MLLTKNRNVLTGDDIKELIDGYTKGSILDYQSSTLLMMIYWLNYIIVLK